MLLSKDWQPSERESLEMNWKKIAMWVYIATASTSLWRLVRAETEWS